MRMTIGTSTAALMFATLVSLSTSTTPQAQAQAPDHHWPESGASSATVARVTLPTGDRVLLGAVDGRPEVRLAPRSGGAPSAPASVISANGHVYVVPVSAQEWVGHGLGLSLFDVTTLAHQSPDGRATLGAAFGPSYHSLPPGLSRRSATSVAVVDPQAFGDALAEASSAQQHPGPLQTPLGGITLTLPGSPATSDGVVTAPAKGRLFTVTVKGIDRAGEKASGDIGVLNNVDDTSRFIAGQTFYRGSFAFSVPRGHYSVQSYIHTVDAGSVSYTLATVPEFLVDRDLTVTLDARDGTRFSVRTPRPSSPVHAELNLQRVPKAGLQFTDSFVTFDETPLFATPTSPVSVGRFYFYPAMRLGDAAGSLDDYLYDVEFPYHGSIPGELRERVASHDVATVDSRYASVVPGLVEQESRIGALPWQSVLVGSINSLVAPSTRLEYVTAQPRLLWHQEVDLDPDNGNGRTLARSTVYSGGQETISSWHNQPMGSGVEQERWAGQACPACRSGDTLSVVLFPQVDAQNDIMLADATATEELTLYEDGTNVGESASGFASFPLSPDPASYQLVYDVDRTAPWWPTSTHVATTWGFDSEERPPSQLPPGWTCGGKLDLDDECSFENLLLVHYRSSAGLDGVIPAGGPARVTIRVAPQRGVDPDPLSELSAQVSYDDGATWRDVTAQRRSAVEYRLSYRQPDLGDTSGFASLRISATSTTGSTVEQTITRAYALATPSSQPAPAPPLACAAPAPAPLTQCLTTVRPGASSVAGAEPPGYSPGDLRQAYDLPRHPTSDATVAIVTPYDNPSAAADLAVYRKQFGLPRCTVSSGCFRIVNQQGDAGPLPAPSPDWGVQTAQALDAVSATCPTCRILLVEANSPSLDDLAPAAATAGRLKADVISNGYGTTGEFSGEQRYEKTYRTLDVPFVVASADYGYGNGAPLIGSISYPSASGYAVAVGGTTLTRDDSERGFSETAWASTTSGCSAYIAKPSWQHDRLCHKRTTADVAAVGDPATGIAVYDTFGFGGWIVVGGTSLATAVVAGVFGLDGKTGPRPPAADLYQPGASLFDVTVGANGECKGSYLCTAGVGFDGPSGVGTPNGISAF